jgi:hypothetical protein
MAVGYAWQCAITGRALPLRDRCGGYERSARAPRNLPTRHRALAWASHCAGGWRDNWADGWRLPTPRQEARLSYFCCELMRDRFTSHVLDNGPVLPALVEWK